MIRGNRAASVITVIVMFSVLMACGYSGPGSAEDRYERTPVVMTNTPGITNTPTVNVPIVNTPIVNTPVVDTPVPVSAGITITPSGGYSTDEGGATDSFDVTLGSEPVGNVVITVASLDESEVTVSPGVLIFNATDYSTPRTVTLGGVDDLVYDGAQAVTVELDPSGSADSDYAALNVITLGVSNADDDAVGILLVPATGFFTDEGGARDSFEVTLSSEPVGDVVITVTSLDASEVTASPSVLGFDSTNYGTPQTVTLSGVDDYVYDMAQVVTVELDPSGSADSDYAALNVITLGVTNADNDSVGISLVPATGFFTDEGGATDSFDVLLSSEPVGDVVIAISSLNESEVTVSPAVLIFNATDYSTPRTVTLSGVDDLVYDGAQSVTVELDASGSFDSDYAVLAMINLGVTNADNDSVGVSLVPNTGFYTDEGGATDSFDVLLSSEPVGDVVIAISSLNESEVTASPSTLIFNSTDYSTPRTVTLTGVDDLVYDGAQSVTVELDTSGSADSDYAALSVINLGVTNADNDSLGMVVTPGSGIATAEGGAPVTFEVSLTMPPASSTQVVFDITSTDISEGTVLPAQIVFDETDWDSPQAVTVTPLDDLASDGNVTYDMSFDPTASTDTGYALMGTQYVSITNVERQSASYSPASVTGLTPLDAFVDSGSNYYVTDVTGGDVYTIQITALSDDADLYVYDNDQSFSSWICRPYNSGTSTETCSITAGGPKMYFLVNGYSTAAGATFTLEVFPGLP